EKESIEETDNVGTLYERLMYKGAGLVLKTVKAIEHGKYPSVPQDLNAEIKHAPKIFKETCEIKWDQPSKKIVDFIRGLSPYPAAWTILTDKTFKIFKAESTPVDSRQLTVDRGPIRTDNKTHLDIKSADGWVSILELQPEGKKRMTIEEFFRGNKL
ncbi:unnamed protein product, partial [Phaeothamnion confervicola]